MKQTLVVTMVDGEKYTRDLVPGEIFADVRADVFRNGWGVNPELFIAPSQIKTAALVVVVTDQ